MIGSKFRSYNKVFQNGFLSNGCNVNIYVSNSRFYKDIRVRIKRMLRIDTSKQIARIYEKQCKDIYEHFLKIKPDLVFVRLGNQLDASTVKKMKESATVILYMSDTLENYPQLIELASAYDLVYSFEKTDIAYLLAFGVIAFPMMGNVDTTHYYPTNSEKSIDVSFIGSMYPERYELLTKLAIDLPELSMEYYGKFSKRKFLKDKIVFFFNGIKYPFKNKNINHVKVNKIYNKSKICLNIQRVEAKDGWNSRLCEILGSNSFQIVNENPSIKKEFQGCLVTYETYEELKTKILYYISNFKEREQIAQRGFSNVLEKFTIRDDIKRILEDVDAYALKKGIKSTNSAD